MALPNSGRQARSDVETKTSPFNEPAVTFQGFLSKL